MQKNNNKLNASFLRDNCQAAWSKIHVFDEIDSTSSWLKTQNQYPIVCLAETQTQGRGRNGNRWQSPDAENIYLSFNWSFDGQPKHLPLLSLWVGIAVAQAIGSLGVANHGIKWPNDLYWKHQKFGGILLETSSASSQVVVGIGINVNVAAMESIEQPWTSLSVIMGHTIGRNKFLVTLLDTLYEAMESFAKLKENVLLSRWRKWDLIRGRQVSFLKQGETCEGVARGIDRSGHLLVDMGAGEVKTFNTSISKVRW